MDSYIRMGEKTHNRLPTCLKTSVWVLAGENIKSMHFMVLISLNGGIKLSGYVICVNVQYLLFLIDLSASTTNLTLFFFFFKKRHPASFNSCKRRQRRRSIISSAEHRGSWFNPLSRSSLSAFSQLSFPHQTAGGPRRAASINATSEVWKKISPPSFINLQDIKAERPRGGWGLRAPSRARRTDTERAPKTKH